MLCHSERSAHHIVSFRAERSGVEESRQHHQFTEHRKRDAASAPGSSLEFSLLPFTNSQSISPSKTPAPRQLLPETPPRSCAWRRQPQTTAPVSIPIRPSIQPAPAESLATKTISCSMRLLSPLRVPLNVSPQDSPQSRYVFFLRPLICLEALSFPR